FSFRIPLPPISTLFPYTTLFRSQLTVIDDSDDWVLTKVVREVEGNHFTVRTSRGQVRLSWQVTGIRQDAYAEAHRIAVEEDKPADRKSTRLNSSHLGISYAVFCL